MEKITKQQAIELWHKILKSNNLKIDELHRTTIHLMKKYIAVTTMCLSMCVSEKENKEYYYLQCFAGAFDITKEEYLVLYNALKAQINCHSLEEIEKYL